jgi:hypothetical protein
MRRLGQSTIWIAGRLAISMIAVVFAGAIGGIVALEPATSGGGSDAVYAAEGPAAATPAPVTVIGTAVLTASPGQTSALYFKNNVYHTASCTAGSHGYMEAQLRMRTTSGTATAIGPDHSVALTTASKMVFSVAGLASDGRLIDYQVRVGTVYHHFQVDMLITKGISCTFRLIALSNF